MRISVDKSRGRWMLTYRGRAHYPHAPRAEEIEIESVAHALATQARFCGHAIEPYSVAQHSVLGSYLVHAQGWGRAAQFAFLMHDTAEAFVVDLPSPVKHHESIYPGYSVAEAKNMDAICERFGVAPRHVHGDIVKTVDEIMLATELRDVMPHADVDFGLFQEPFGPFGFVRPWGWEFAKQAFLERFNELCRPEDRIALPTYRYASLNVLRGAGSVIRASTDRGA